MGELTHKAARAAFGKAIELTLKHVEKDREKGLLQLVDLTKNSWEIISHQNHMKEQET